MNAQPKKNFIKKLIYLTGVVSVSVGLNVPAFAGINDNSSGFKPLSTDQNYQVDSNRVFAQSKPDDIQQPTSGGEVRQSPPSSEGNITTPSSSTSPASPSNETDRTTLESSPSGSNTTDTERARYTNEGRLVRGSWLCSNNPNPQCNN